MLHKTSNFINLVIGINEHLSVACRRASLSNVGNSR